MYTRLDVVPPSRIPWGVFTIALIVRATIALSVDARFDDAYITFRVARNIVDHGEFAYNLGEHVQASTSLLYTALCAGIYAIFGSARMPAVASWVGVAADAAAAGLLARLVQGLVSGERGRVAAMGAGVFYATLSTCTLVAPGGLETGLYGLCIVATFLARREERLELSAITAGLAALTRPEGALVALVLVGSLLLSDKSWKRPLAILIALLAPVFVAQWAYFGTCIPQTVAAKSLIMRSVAEQWRLFLNKFFIGSIPQAVVGATACIGAVRHCRTVSVRPIVAWGGTYIVVFSTFGMWWPWYWPPVALLIGTLFGLGASAVLCFLFARWTEANRRAASLAIFALIGIALVAKTRGSWEALQSQRPPVAAQRRMIGEWLEANTPRDASIFVEPMGEIGFYTSRRIDDFPGLASPAVTGALRSLGRRVGGNPTDAEAVSAVLRDVRPTHLILRRDELAACRDSHLLGDYAVVFEHAALFNAGNAATLYVLARRN